MDQYLTEAVAAGQSKEADCVVDVMQWTSISQRMWLLAKLRKHIVVDVMQWYSISQRLWLLVSLRKHIVLLTLCSGPVSHRGCGCWLG